MNISCYLNRIGLSHDVDCSLDTLKLIQKHHMMNVPFENLDFFVRGIHTDIDSLYERIVNKNRGGICYELNLLCQGLLQEIGFETKIFGSNVSQEHGDFYDHLLLLVKVKNEEYIFDASFTFLQPLLFKEDIIQEDPRGLYRIKKYKESFYHIERYSNETSSYNTEYIIHYTSTKAGDFKARMDHFENNEASLFRQNIYCNFHLEDGKVLLKPNEFVTIQNGQVKKEVIDSFEQFNDYLKSVVHLHYSDKELSCLKENWLRIKSL